MPKLSNSKGEPTAAIHGYVGSLIKILRTYKPDYITACFDRGEQLFRKDLYPEYKADHKPQVEELWAQWNGIYEATAAFNIERYEMRKYEADDLIGTLSKMAEEKGHRVIIYAYDADMFQLVTNNVTVVTPKAEVTPSNVQSRFGILPNQVAEYKALIGDPSDNVPRFFGEKTASFLLTKYGTISGIYNAIKNEGPIVVPMTYVKGDVNKKFLDNEEAIRLNIKLTTIVRNLPILFPEKTHTINDTDVIAFLRKMEFQQMLGRFEHWRMTGK
jgi:DNA polymerase-1